MNYRQMTFSDYEAIYNLWINTPGMGLNSVDDSKDGIEKFLKRNSTTCFVAENAMTALEKEGITKVALVVFEKNISVTVSFILQHWI